MLITCLLDSMAAHPPVLTIPSLGDAPLGWIMGIVALLGPIVFTVMSWQRRRGHWKYFFAQWRTVGFWLFWCGTVITAGGLFALIGIVPALQDQWNTWYVAAVTAVGADRVGLEWLNQVQGFYFLSLQFAAGAVFLSGATALLLGLSRLSRRMATFRVEPDAWLLAPPESAKVPAVRRGRQR